MHSSSSQFALRTISFLYLLIHFGLWKTSSTQDAPPAVTQTLDLKTLTLLQTVLLGSDPIMLNIQPWGFWIGDKQEQTPKHDPCKIQPGVRKHTNVSKANNQRPGLKGCTITTLEISYLSLNRKISVQTPVSSAAGDISHYKIFLMRTFFVFSFKGLCVQRSVAPAMLLWHGTTQKIQGTPVEGPSL